MQKKEKENKIGKETTKEEIYSEIKKFLKG